MSLIKINKPIRNTNSRYNSGFCYRDEDGVVFLPTRKRIIIDLDVSDGYHIVSEGHRLDLIAVKYYGTPDLWWTIAEVNGVMNPFDVEPGQMLRIPSLSEIYSKIIPMR